MTRTLLLSIVAGASVIAAGACGDAASTSVNSTNTNQSAVNPAVSLAGNTGNTAANPIKETTDSPSVFIINAARGSMADVEIGKLAAQKSQNPQLKKFAQMMVEEHTKANAELKTLAGKKNVSLPTDLGTYKPSVESLNAASGADFDKEYVDLMVRDHEASVAAFKRQAADGSDADLQAFAEKTLPTLQKHLEMIKAIEEELHK